MIMIKSPKPLIQAIKAGERNVRITTPRFLAACAIADQCDGDITNIKRFLECALARKNNIYLEDRPPCRIGIVTAKGKTYQVKVNLSICAASINVIELLNENHVGLKMEKDMQGFVTGNAEIFR